MATPLLSQSNSPLPHTVFPPIHAHKKPYCPGYVFPILAQYPKLGSSLKWNSNLEYYKVCNAVVFVCMMECGNVVFLFCALKCAIMR
jgi:hypothetical protein